jgi:hypothetical protein
MLGRFCQAASGAKAVSAGGRILAKGGGDVPPAFHAPAGGALLGAAAPDEGRETSGGKMSSESAVTISRMLESLPEQLKEQVVEHLREYISELKDEMRWSSSFASSQDKLAAAAKHVRKEIKEGKAAPLDIDRL